MKETTSDKATINLLWTGGWDSTFQLLQLLLIHQQRVTPFYLIDADRQSTGAELQAMKLIKDRILKEHPHVHKLLGSTQYFSIGDIPANSEITQAFQAILKEKEIGTQYDWLSRFCREHGITDMQLCTHAMSQQVKGRFYCKDIVLREPDDSKTVSRIDPKFAGSPEDIVFGCFSFPIIGLNKTQMCAISKEQKLDSILNMTWFCHKPTKRLLPCGKCNPCIQAIDEGLGWRIPVRRRIISFFYKRLIRPLIRPIFLPLRSLLKIILVKLGIFSYVKKNV